MYTCSLHIYSAGHPSHALDVLKKMPSLERFTHIFSESDEAEAALSAKADVIIADLSHMDVQYTLQILLQNRREDTEVILLADKKQMQILCAESILKDI